MKRRDFFKTAAVGSGALLLNPFSISGSNHEGNSEKQFKTDFDLDEITVTVLQEKMAQDELDSETIVRKYIERIKEIDEKGPALRSVIQLDPDAVETAKAADLSRKAGKVIGPLHGIPVLIKDNIDTHDKLMTTAGSLAMNGFIAPRDAFIVEKLRKSGAVLLGKTNLSEWANIRSTRSSSGWSGRGGQVRNPYLLDRSPCGSSSGSGVAVSSNLCVLAIGTETDGSIVCPSGINGIVGIKPTVGLWSRHGIVPISHSQDTAGPMARTVKDAALLLGPLAGIDEKDESTLAGKGKTYADYTQFVNANGLSGSRIGLITDFMGFDPNVDSIMAMQVQKMKQNGAEIIEVKCADKRKEWSDAEWVVLLYELKADLNRYLQERTSAPVRSLKDIIKFNEQHARTEMPWFGQDIFLLSESKGDLNTPEYVEAKRLSQQLTRETIDRTMETYHLDALIAPTNAPAWTIDWVNGDHFIGGSSDLAAISGYPSISVPAGMVHGLPVGLSFIGKAWSEPALIKLASGFEQISPERKKPTFIQSLI